MYRLFFFTKGLFLAFSGLTLFAVDSVTLNPAAAKTLSLTLGGVTIPPVINPPDWMPFSLIGLGAITFMYAIAIPRRPLPPPPVKEE